MEIILFQQWALGFREVTSNFPILACGGRHAGVQIAHAAGKMWVESFKALGASPAPIDFAEEYTALQTHVVDGQETPTRSSCQPLLRSAEDLSVTNHMWTGNWFAANKEAWNSPPPNVRDVVTKTVAKYAVLQTARRRTAQRIDGRQARNGWG